MTGLLVLLVLALCAAPAAFALEVPALKTRVNDYAGMLSASTRTQLESALQGLERSDSTQIVVLTVPSLEGDSLEDFSMRAAEAWKIGQKGADNGAILLIAKNDRKIRIEVGYGLEGTLTDLVSGRIIRNVIGPRFKNGDFDGGVAQGVGAMIGVVKGQYTAQDFPDGKKPAKGDKLGGLVIFALFLMFSIGRLSKILGAGVGGFLGLAAALALGLGAVWILGMIMAGVLAGFATSLISGAMPVSTGASRRSGFWIGGGGGFGGGGFGGFSGGGGGFGGGGASGGW